MRKFPLTQSKVADSVTAPMKNLLKVSAQLLLLPIVAIFCAIEFVRIMATEDLD